MRDRFSQLDPVIFKILGIKLSQYDGNRSLNFKAKYKKSKRESRKTRHLTPLGKIIAMNSLQISHQGP